MVHTDVLNYLIYWRTEMTVERPPVLSDTAKVYVYATPWDKVDLVLQ